MYGLDIDEKESFIAAEGMLFHAYFDICTAKHRKDHLLKPHANPMY